MTIHGSIECQQCHADAHSTFDSKTVSLTLNCFECGYLRVGVAINPRHENGKFEWDGEQVTEHAGVGAMVYRVDGITHYVGYQHEPDWATLQQRIFDKFYDHVIDYGRVTRWNPESKVVDLLYSRDESIDTRIER